MNSLNQQGRLQRKSPTLCLTPRVRVWERVDRLTGETQTYFVYDGDTLVTELDANGNPIAEYSWGLLGPIARHDLQNPSNNRYYVLDALGHTRALLDNQGNITDRRCAGANPAARRSTLTN